MQDDDNATATIFEENYHSKHEWQMKSTPKNYKLIEDKECLNVSKNNQSVLGKQS